MTYNITNRLSRQARKAIENCIEQHEYYKRAYFWASGSNSNQRRRNEEKFEEKHPAFKLQNGDKLIEVTPNYSESCNHCYYSLSVTVGGSTKNILALKKLLK